MCLYAMQLKGKRMMETGVTECGRDEFEFGMNSEGVKWEWETA